MVAKAVSLFLKETPVSVWRSDDVAPARQTDADTTTPNIAFFLQNNTAILLVLTLHIFPSIRALARKPTNKPLGPFFPLLAYFLVAFSGGFSTSNFEFALSRAARKTAVRGAFCSLCSLGAIEGGSVQAESFNRYSKQSVGNDVVVQLKRTESPPTFALPSADYGGG